VKSKQELLCPFELDSPKEVEAEMTVVVKDDEDFGHF
jgi:hypothetical protein